MKGTGYEHEISGTVTVNASDPSVKGSARYMVAKVIDGSVWYYTAFNDLERAKEIVRMNGEAIPSFIIDRGEP